MSTKRFYLLLPVFAVLAIGSVSFAQEFDREALKAELREELKTELKQELLSEIKEEMKAEILSETKAEVQEATEASVISFNNDFKAELRAEIMEETRGDISSEVEKALWDAPLLSGLFKGTTVSGFLDVSYMYNLRNHGEGVGTGTPADRTSPQTRENANGYVNFIGENDDHTFALENFAMFFDKATTEEHPIGWQAHLYFGEKAKRITFLGDRAGITGGDGDTAAGVAAATSGTDDTARNDIVTVAAANLTWDVPVFGKRVPVTMGKMYTWIGYELVENIGNPNYSHGMIYNNAIPFTHMGISVDVSEFLPSDKLGLTLYAVDGWDSFIDNNKAKTFGFYLTYQPTDDFFISLATISGAEGWGRRGAQANGDVTQMLDIVATYALPQVEKLSLGFNFDWGQSENSGLNTASTGHWYGVVGYAMYDFTDTQQGAFRYEYFDDSDGVKTFRNSMYSLTYTHNVTIHENVLLRPEIRYNKYNGTDQLTPGDKGNTADDEFILGMGAEYVF